MAIAAASRRAVAQRARPGPANVLTAYDFGLRTGGDLQSLVATRATRQVRRPGKLPDGTTAAAGLPIRSGPAH